MKRYVVYRASKPGVYLDTRYESLDEAIDDLSAMTRERKFVVDTRPWVGFKYDDHGDIVRDEHGVAIPEEAGFTEITVFDAPMHWG